MSVIDNGNETVKKLTQTRDNILKHKKEHQKYYKDILEFSKNKDCSEAIKKRIRTYLKIGDKKMILFSNDNCFLVGIKKSDYFDFIKSNDFEKYIDTETFNNNDYTDNEIKTKQLQESFMKTEEITIYNYDDKKRTEHFMKHYRDVICILVEPPEEEKLFIPFWHTFYISSTGKSGPFKYGQEKYLF